MQKEQKKIIFFLYLIFFIIGCFIFMDYGVGIEENFQRASGFYWLDYIANLTNFSRLQEICKLKLDELYRLNPNLPKVSDNLAYGIIFDVPVALIEIILNFKESYNNIYLKHFLTFSVFLVSSYCFTLLLIKRFSNIYISIFGTFAYFLSPKIFGASFFDGKDIFFLSILTISIFFYLKFDNSKTLRNLIIFSLFASFAASSRPPGFLIPISFFLIYFFKILCEKKNKNDIKTIFIFCSAFLVFLTLQWPYLWDLNLNLKQSYGDINLKVYFSGIFYEQKNLPISYIPKWIFISTPLYIFLLFVLGLMLSASRFYKRFILIKNNKINKYKYDLWRSANEKFDFFILICFGQTVFIYLMFMGDIFSSWRHFYFVHFFLSYYFSMFINFLFLKSRNFSKKKSLIFLILTLCSFEQVYKLYKYHPYQNIYFNNLLSEKTILKYERDTAHLSRLEALREIIKISQKENKKIKLGTASWSPLGDVLIMFKKDDLKNIEFIGNNEISRSDYIFTNYIYEINTNLKKKYDIPNNFTLYKSVKKDKTLIYSLYKKK